MRARADQVRLLKRRADSDSIRLTAVGVVPLDPTCPSSREARLGPAGTAYTYNNGIVVATDSDGSLKGHESRHPARALGEEGRALGEEGRALGEEGRALGEEGRALREEGRRHRDRGQA